VRKEPPESSRRSGAMSDEPASVGDVLDRLRAVGEEHDRVTVGQAVEALGNRSYGPFLLVPALVEETPIGSIPGVPTAVAAVIVLFAAQMLWGRTHMWLPGFVRDRAVAADKVERASDKLRGLADWLDRWFHGRLEVLTKGPAVRLAAAMCILLACTVPPLEVLPWASSLPMGAIAAFGLALLVRDGGLMIAATLMSLAALGFGIGWLGS